MSLRRPRRAGHRGQALVEFALVLPIFVFLLMILFDFGRVVYAWHTITDAAREATRDGQVSPEFDNATGQYMTKSDSTLGIRGAALRMVPGVAIDAADITGDTTTGSPYKQSCTTAGATVNDAYAASTCFYPDGTALGSPVVVRIEISIPLITPIMSNALGGSITVTAQSVSYIQ
jgi:Flp pilus assembly protein TadG